eukprot:403368715
MILFDFIILFFRRGNSRQPINAGQGSVNQPRKVQQKDFSEKGLEPTKAEIFKQIKHKEMSIDDIVKRLANNPKETLMKFQEKLGRKLADESQTQEQILKKLCEFLITEEGKLRATHTLSVNTLNEMYLRIRKAVPAQNEENKLQRQMNEDALNNTVNSTLSAQNISYLSNAQQANPMPEIRQSVLQEQMVSQQQANPPKPSSNIIAQQQISQVINSNDSENINPNLLKNNQDKNVQSQAQKEQVIDQSMPDQPSLKIPNPNKRPKILINEKINNLRQQRLQFHNQIKYNYNDLSLEALELKRSTFKICYFDSQPAQNQANLFCVCESQAVANQELLQCTVCQYKSHKACMGDNAKMKRFICAHCQLLYIDPLQLPIQTLLKPFQVHQASQKELQYKQGKFSFKFPPTAQKKFALQQNILDQILTFYHNSNSPQLLIQVRCIRMNNGDALLNNTYPQFGCMALNQSSRNSIKNEFTIKDPPNDKKRIDKIIDVTKSLKSGDNLLELFQILRPDRGDTHKYVCGVFIVKNYEEKEFTSYIKNLQPVIPFQEGLAMISKRFQKSNNDATEDCKIEQQDVKIDLKCQITQKKIQVPVKGQWCEHDLCFDLDNYIAMNARPTCRLFKCPCRPSDKPVILKRDEFTMRLLEIARPEEDTLSINENLEIMFKDKRTYIVRGNKFALKDSPIESSSEDEEEKDFVASHLVNSSSKEQPQNQQYLTKPQESNSLKRTVNQRENEQQPQSVHAFTYEKQSFSNNDIQIDIDCSDGSDLQQPLRNQYQANGLNSFPGEDPKKRQKIGFSTSQAQQQFQSYQPAVSQQQQIQQQYGYDHQMYPQMMYQPMYLQNQMQMNGYQGVNNMMNMPYQPDQSQYLAMQNQQQQQYIMNQAGQFGSHSQPQPSCTEILKSTAFHSNQREFADMFQQQNQNEVQKQTQTLQAMRMKDLVPTNQQSQQKSAPYNKALNQKSMIANGFQGDIAAGHHTPNAMMSRSNAIGDVANSMINGKESKSNNQFQSLILENKIISTHLRESNPLPMNVNTSNQMNQTTFNSKDPRNKSQPPVNRTSTSFMQQGAKLSPIKIQNPQMSNQNIISQQKSGISALPQQQTQFHHANSNPQQVSIQQNIHPHMQQQPMSSPTAPLGHGEVIEIDD